ncbi:hypothetical protein Glove_279g21 [Diversispora epigaea]|uniref:Protein kinase domain-containing protein n=1 Tax=Diversispora epigaea TaxID=1348612 RepID=A0A397I9B6_9GLOM|nr:hypothetical protein Glove_279g21 [Diversispora epigaea]
MNKFTLDPIFTKKPLSGNPEIDKFLEEFKNNTNFSFQINNNDNNDEISQQNTDKSIRWIPFTEFDNLVEMGKGRSGIVFSAIWNGAPEQKYDLVWNKKRVVLKVLANSGLENLNFLKELRIYYQCMDSFRILPCYGISQQPYTNNYILVMQYASEGDLRKYIEESFIRFDWWQRINMIKDIMLGLKTIHSIGLMHQDFHSGNILRHGYGHDSGNLDTYISDLRINYNNNDDNNNDNDGNKKKRTVFGVLPYIAPEVLHGHQYTKSSDIYSLGIIMWEITAAGKKPFQNLSHDEELARSICNGLRPEIINDTPKCYVNMMRKCWDADPKARPTVEELLEMVREFKDIPQYKRQINKAESQRLKNDWMRDVAKNNNSQHPKAIYSSRRFSFENLPQPKNPIIPEDEDDQDDYSLKDVQLRRRATTTSVKFDNRRINKFAKDRRSVQILSSQQFQNINPVMKYAPQIPPIQAPQRGQLERNNTIIQREHSSRSNTTVRIKPSPIQHIQISNNNNNQEIPTSPTAPVSPRYAPKPSTIANRKVKRKSRTFSVEEKERLKNNNSLISSFLLKNSKFEKLKKL